MNSQIANPKLKQFNLSRLPEASSEFVGEFFNQLWEDARKEKISRLGLHQRFLDLHAQFRGKKRKMNYPRIGANHIFKTVEGYCATLTEKMPISELTADGADDEALVKAFDSDNKAWWLSTGQQFLLYASAQNMQVYGTTLEKAVWNTEKDEFEVVLRDVFNGFPAPGYKICSMDLPYFCDVDFLSPSEIRNTFGLPEEIDIPHDADEQLAGTVRETTRGGRADSITGRHYPTNYAPIQSSEISDALKEKTMVVEIWIKDNSIKQTPVMGQMPVTDDLGRPIIQNGQPMIEEVETGEIKTEPNYPDGVRKVTICPALLSNQQIKGVLDDSINPSINWTLLEMRVDDLVTNGYPQPAVGPEGPIVDPATGQPVMQPVPVEEADARALVYGRAKLSFPLWGQFPYNAVPSRVDTSQWWGFSIIEQLEELQGKAELMLTKYLLAYERHMYPILVNPNGSGVDNAMITNEPGIVINPTVATANLFRFIEPPQPPREYLEVIQFLYNDMDIIAMTPAVSQGQRPSGISAAAAIIALQDKASTLTSPQIRNIDKIIEWRGKAQIHFNMNFDTTRRQVLIDGQPGLFRGIDVFSQFKFVVESGSSAPITKAGRRQLYIELFKLGAMDLESLLEYLDIPQAKKIVERVTEQKSLTGALTILAQAGVPPEMIQQIYMIAKQAQTQVQPMGGTSDKTAEQAAPAGGYSEGLNASKQGMSELREG